MNKNLGSIDKIIRFIIAAVFVALYFMGIITGVLGIVLLVLAGVLVLTSLISFCPLYPIVGMNTSKGEEKK